MTYKEAAHMHYAPSKGVPPFADSLTRECYMRPYFTDFGAGAAANELLEKEYDAPMDDLWGRINTNPTNSAERITKERPSNLIELMKQLDSDYTAVWKLKGERRDRAEALQPIVDKANRVGIAVGIPAGLLGAGALYAGLGLIPALKKQRLLRALSVIGSGIGIGALAGNAASKYVFSKSAAMSPEEKQLRRIARPYYPAVGRRSWEHVNQVMRNAEMITQGMENRPLTLQEKAAIYFHDCAIRQRGTGKEHGKYGRETAIPLLLATGIFNDKQLDEIGTAILEHDTLNATGKKFSNKTGEVLASGDANTPDLPWLLNKFYNWQLQNNPDKESWPTDIYETAINEFGNKSTEKFPALYNKFHGDRVQKLRDQIDSMSQDDMWNMVQKYRKKHRLDETDERLGTPPWFKPY